MQEAGEKKAKDGSARTKCKIQDDKCPKRGTWEHAIAGQANSVQCKKAIGG